MGRVPPRAGTGWRRGGSRDPALHLTASGPAGPGPRLVMEVAQRQRRERQPRWKPVMTQARARHGGARGRQRFGPHGGLPEHAGGQQAGIEQRPKASEADMLEPERTAARASPRGWDHLTLT